MTLTELTAALAGIRATFADKIAALNRELEQAALEQQQAIETAISDAGFFKCVACNGSGKETRKDADHMRKYGKRWWNGCVACGGDDGEIPGRGFLTTPPPKPTSTEF